MRLMPKKKSAKILLIFVISYLMLLTLPAQAQLRNLKVGDRMPEFSLPFTAAPVPSSATIVIPILTSAPDTSSATIVMPAVTTTTATTDTNVSTEKEVMFTYKHNRKRVLGIVFIAENQEQSQRAVKDIKKIVARLEQEKTNFDFVYVLSKQSKEGASKSSEKEPVLNFPVLLDDEYKLWGKLGVIATPTVLIVDGADNIMWVKAGYGYDFMPAVQLHLKVALGLIDKDQVDQVIKVKTLSNNGAHSKAKRHLAMARMLEKKGRFESALKEANKAKELEPDSIEVALAAGKLSCRIGRGEEALAAIAGIEPEKRIDTAQMILVSGWAKRLLGDFDSAEKLLLEAVTSNPKASRGFYELGRVYRSRGETGKAMEAFAKALSLVYADPVVSKPIVKAKPDPKPQTEAGVEKSVTESDPEPDVKFGVGTTETTISH